MTNTAPTFTGRDTAEGRAKKLNQLSGMIGTASANDNLDGGFPESIYLATGNVDCGDVSGNIDAGDPATTSAVAIDGGVANSSYVGTIDIDGGTP